MAKRGNKMKTGSVIGLSVLGGVLVLGVLPISCTANSLPAQNEKVKQAWGNVEVMYKRRAELIPQLVAVADTASNREIKLVVETIKARAEGLKTTINLDGTVKPGQEKAYLAQQNALSTALTNMKVVMERYPDPKFHAQFTALSKEIAGSQNRVSVAEADWTRAVQVFNSIILSPFPGGIANKLFYSYSPYEQFKADPSMHKAPTVEFKN